MEGAQLFDSFTIPGHIDGHTIFKNVCMEMAMANDGGTPNSTISHRT